MLESINVNQLQEAGHFKICIKGNQSGTLVRIESMVVTCTNYRTDFGCTNLYAAGRKFSCYGYKISNTRTITIL